MLPILKYYLNSPVSLKVRASLSKKHIESFYIEKGTRDGLECLIYSSENPCDKAFLNKTTSLLKWLQDYFEGRAESSLSIKLPKEKKVKDLVERISKIPFGSEINLEDLLNEEFSEITEKQFYSLRKQNSHQLLIPFHRVQEAQSKRSPIEDILKEFEKEKGIFHKSK
jgi:O6-methylguanine-DNA--protein-cysteine methyltransferase